MTTTISPLDETGRITVTTPRHRITIAPRYDREPRSSAIYIENPVALAADEELRQLHDEEASLGDRRWARRGKCPDVDALYDRLNARWLRVWEQIAREILPDLAGAVDGDPAALTDSVRGNPKAGCDACPCSPGVSVPGLTCGGFRVNVWVNPITEGA